MCLRFAFLLATRAASWLRLSRRDEAWKTAEILILRHQLTVLQRHQPCRPKLTWADRALLVTLLSLIPKARRQRLRLLVTPDTILRWHRDIVRRRWAARSRRGKTGRAATAGGSEHTSQTIKLVPDCIHTIVILDTPGHLKIDDLLDSAGATEMPTGGVETGLGGTAPRPGSPAAPWLVGLGAGGLFTLAGGLVIRRARRRPLHAR